MSGYWVRHRLFLTIALAVIVSGVMSLLFAFPVVEKNASIYNSQSVYKNSKVDFIAPEPSYEQVETLAGSEGIDKVFPFYLTKTDVKANEKSRTTTVLLSDQFDNVGITMYNDARLIEKTDDTVTNPVLVDWQFCKDTSSKLGDTITFTLNGESVSYTIQAIYETNTIYDGGAILVNISEAQKDAIAANAGNNGYSAMYISASDYSSCKNYLTNDYRPLARLRDRSQFDSDEQYQVHYDAIMSSGYANEITDCRIREQGLSEKDNSLMIWLGAILSVIAVIAFNIVMSLRGCEKVYFAKHCIPKGIKVKPYYSISAVCETVGMIALFVAFFYVRIKLSTAYIPMSSVGFIVAVIPVAMIIGEIVSSKLNNAKVSAMITRFKAEEAKKKAELEKQKMAQNIQPIDNKK